ncbi:hypothetical protein GCM10027261_14120 [Geodermatophilus arenarius]|uniref:Uncharacterized protein n=1 Tax=Geodermatophilus arenarius TaxID=1137990 RepID=A0ABV9LHA4_9ACTN
MDYDIVKRFRAEFGGQVEEVYVNGRRVGMVYRDPKPPAEIDELWMAYTQGGQGARSRDEALRAVLRHAEENPDYELQ